MKNMFVAILIGLSCGYGASVKAQQIQGFTLSGQFKGLPDGTKLYLRTQEQDTVAKTTSRGDKFTFTGKLPLNGRFHFIVMDTLVSKIGTRAIFIENKAINVIGTIGSIEIIVQGSQAHLDFEKFREDDSKIMNIDEKLKFRSMWVSNHRESLVAPWGIKFLGSSEEKLKAYNALSPLAKSSYYGVDLKRDLETVKMSAQIQEGKVIPNFLISDLEGKQIGIIDIAAENKYTLVDCWASWCKPCRAEVPKLKKIYEKYRDKGFAIAGISSDQDNVAWKKAVKEDQTTWPHFIQDKTKQISKAFDLRAIPAYIIIDSNGKLIAFDCAMSSISNFGGSLRGEALDKKLEELLGSNK